MIEPYVLLYSTKGTGGYSNAEKVLAHGRKSAISASFRSGFVVRTMKWMQSDKQRILSFIVLNTLLVCGRSLVEFVGNSVPIAFTLIIDYLDLQMHSLSVYKYNNSDSV